MIMRRTTSVLAVGTVLLLFATAVRFAKAQDSPADFSDYFETKVRPILVNNYLKSEPMKEYDEYKNQKSATSNPTNEIKPTNTNHPTTNSTAASDAIPPGAKPEPSPNAAGVPPDMPAVTDELEAVHGKSDRIVLM